MEHAAKFVGETPSTVARDEELLSTAHIKAFEQYGHELINVGIDVYNIEAEALGCIVSYHDDFSVPGISKHVFEEFVDFEGLDFSINKGRIKTILNASYIVKEKIGDRVQVNVGICGPFSIAVELRSYENLIMDCIDENEELIFLLDKILVFQKRYCDEIIKRGLGITVFESWATPPLITPDIYRKYAMPYEQKLIDYMKYKGLASAPLVIGGDTTSIIDDMISTGTTLLVADYCVDTEVYIRKGSKHGLTVRGNIDPKLVGKGPQEDILNALYTMLSKRGEYKNFIIGTGVIPYGTPIENLMIIKKELMEGI